MRTLLLDGSVFARTTYMSYQAATGNQAPGPHHLLHAFINRIASVTRPHNLGAHQVVVVLRSVSETMPAHFQGQQLALPPQLSAFGVKVVQLADKGNIAKLCQLANSPQFQDSGLTIGSDNAAFFGYLSPTTHLLRNDKAKAMPRFAFPALLKLADPQLVPPNLELPALATLQEMLRISTQKALRLLTEWRSYRVFSGREQTPESVAEKFALAATADERERHGVPFWTSFAAKWREIFPTAAEQLADYTLPKPSRDALKKELAYYRFDQLVGYVDSTDWAAGIVA